MPLLHLTVMHDTHARDLFLQIFQSNREKVFRFAYKLTRDSLRAEEITQRCFIRLWENIHAFDSSKDPFPLLFVYVKNILIDETRRLYRERKKQASYQATLESSDHAEQEQTLLHNEFRRHLQKVIEKMPEQRRQIYLLSRQHGKSHREIALQLNLSPLTVRNHLHLAMQFIRQEMLAHYDLL